MGRVPTVSRGRQKILSGRHGGVSGDADRASAPTTDVILISPPPRALILGAALVLSACGSGGSVALEGRPDSLAFDAVAVGELSAPRVVEWTNAGADTVSIGELRLTGDASGDFLIEDDACSGGTLEPGRSCTAVLLFAPREAGPRAATLSATSGSRDGRHVSLLGEGAPGESEIVAEGLVRAVPETLYFGDQPLGTTAGPLAVRLVNQRPGAVQFAARLRAGASGDYRVALDRCSNEILGAGRACTVRILFAPAAEGLRTGELVLRDLNGTTTQTVPLVGNGAPLPDEAPTETGGPPLAVPLIVRPRAIEFGLQPVGSTSEARIVRVENNGAAGVVLSILRLAGEGADEFRVVGGDCERRSLIPTRTCSIEIVYRPNRAGAHAARIEAVTSAGVEPALVVLSGTGDSR